MDGVWRGPAWIILDSGQKHQITQTERIGAFLDGSVKVMEGRGYEPDGRVKLQCFRNHFLQPDEQELYSPFLCHGECRRFCAEADS